MFAYQIEQNINIVKLNHPNKSKDRMEQDKEKKMINHVYCGTKNQQEKEFIFHALINKKVKSIN